MYLQAMPPSRLRSQIPLLFFFASLLVLATLPASTSWLRQVAPGVGSAQSNLDRLPLSFEPNIGQAASAQYIAHAPGGTLYFSPGGVRLALSSGSRESATAEMTFVNPSTASSITQGAAMPGKVNYFFSNNPANWQTNVPTYSGLTYNNLYNGITLQYEGTGGKLKGTYLVAPNADPAQIRWQYANASGLSLDASGNLNIALQGSSQSLTEVAPVVWQEIDGSRVAVSASYFIGGNNTVGFALGNYDNTAPLFIDPTLTYSTFFGGTGSDTIAGVGFDSAGDIYIAGYTDSADLPTHNPIQPNLRGSDDFFVSKLSPDGSTLLYSTYLGGTDEEEVTGLAVDAAGNAYLAGYTQSSDYPVLNAVQSTFGGYYDAAVAKLTPSGGLVYSTYLGGSVGSINSSDEAFGVAADSAGNTYVTGDTASSDFPVANAFQATANGSYDAFVSKIAPNGLTLIYSTYLGGDSYDSGMSIAVDTVGSAYVTGRTDSTNYPLVNPLQPNPGAGDYDMDAFVTKFNPAGSALAYSTYLGGSDNEPMYKAGIAVDGAGNAYVTGSTYSSDFPVVNAYQDTRNGLQDAYLSKINPAGSALVYSTYFGGSRFEEGHGVAADAAGNVYIVGETSSPDYPLVDPVQSTYGGGLGGGDAFIAAFGPDGVSPIYSTYLGGAGVDDAYAVTTDGAGNTLVGGYTSSADFPIRTGAYQSTLHGSSDGFLANINYVAPPTPTGTPPTATPRPPTNTRTFTVTNTPTATYTPNPCGVVQWNVVPSTSGSDYEDVAALSDNNVWAVGWDIGSVSGNSTIAHYTGSSWDLVPHPDPSTSSNTLYGVKAISPDDIWAVGSYVTTESNSLALALHWDGQSWTQFTTPTLPQGQGYYSRHVLEAVTGTASDDVWAVGTALTENKYKAIVYHWDGTAWSLANAFDIPNEDSHLKGVVELAPDDIWAVGWYGANGYDYTYKTFTVHWDGSSWSVVDSPNPGGPGNYSTLRNVDAVSSNDVYAVGSYTDYSNTLQNRTLVLHWDGTQWSQQTSPYRGTGSNDLYAVRVVSANDIWAVGSSIEDYNVGATQSLTLHSDGTQWTVVSSPNRGTASNVLQGIDVLSSSDIWSVGYMGNGNYDSYVLQYSDACLTPSPTGTGTPPTATPRPPTSTRTPTNTNTSTPSATPTVCGLEYPVLEGFETGNLGTFVSSVATCVPGGCGWVSSNERVHTGSYSAHAPDLGGITDQLLTLAAPITVPSVVLSSTLTFWHSYMLDQGFDGGVLEASTDGGTTWSDVGANITEGGYTGLLSSISGNPIGGRNAWTGSSGSSFVRVTVNLAPYAGHSLLFRFRLGTDNSVGHLGWWIDDVTVTVVTNCGGSTATPVPPTATGTPSSATDTPVQATGTPATDTPVQATGTPATATDTPIALSPTATDTPSPEPTQGAACTISFSDVLPGNPFYASIMCMACSGYVSGYADGTFRPANLITRGQLAKLVANVSQMPQGATGQSFEDVPEGSTFYPYIQAIAAAGYIQGYPCGGAAEPCGAGNRPYYRPGANATRGQVTKIVANAAHLMDGGNNPVLTEPMFADVLVGNPYYMYAQVVGARSFMSGYPCGGAGEPCDSQNRPYFRPVNNATRGQASKILANAFYVACTR